MELAYYLVTDEMDISDVCADVIKNKESMVMLPFDPHDILPEDIKALELYFAKIEDYDKASRLRDIYDNYEEVIK